MFKNEYQGGAVVDIFSAQGNDPVAKWKLYGGQSAISKEFDKEIKGFVYILEGRSQTNKMQIPKDSRMALGLSQRFLVLQMYVPPGKDFCIELMITDSGNLKRRLYLSTVHKELSATPLHAKIPLSSFRLNIWCNMCIDLVSFTGEIFKGAAFLSLDRIIVCASCRLRRIFTMKLQPPDTISESGMFTNRGSNSVRGAKIQDVCHIAFGSKVPGPPPPTGRKTSASGGREVFVSGAKASQTCGLVRQNSGDWTEKQSYCRETNPIAGLSCIPQQCEDSGQAFQGLTGRPWSLQPHPPPGKSSVERAGVRKPRAYSAGREKPAQTAAVQSCNGNETRFSESPARPYCRTTNSAGPLGPSAIVENPTADKGSSHSSVKDISGLDSPKQAQENLLRLVESPSPINMCDHEEGEGPEPQLSLEDVFTFSSRPHSARRGQGHPNPMEGSTSSPGMWGEGDGACRGARMEDDFYGSESEEDESHSAAVVQRPCVQCSPGVPTSTSPKSRTQTPDGEDVPNAEYLSCSPDSGSAAEPLESNSASTATVSQGDSSDSRKTEVDYASIVPVRSLSPSRNRLGYSLDLPTSATPCQDNCIRASLSRKSLKEIPIGDSRLDVEHTGNSGKSHKPIGISTSESYTQGSLGNQEEEEELRMLASLLRQQEEEREELYEESRSPGLSTSQIHNCNVSISTSSDDTSAWTPYVPMPAYQGHHYQEEMSPLLHSNPRERLNVLSPPIFPPSQQARREGTGQCQRDTMTEAEILTSEENEEDEFLNLLYDPCLNCYFDPASGKYYELI
ncbi:uncharacterized protein C3orf67 homolog [Megalops cyprinoides]|uniref:uncharacterized protein C3orf67 homolog n=1 Tax=Megalops cyprinoides TaxID=118141 RepID=UPI001864AC4C|nr:uncharacterized protein C3orf67 homolog [Megalops cyprinoides]